MVENAAQSTSRELDALRAENATLRDALLRVAELTDEIAGGNLEPRLPTNEDDPDVRRVALGLNRMLDVTDAFVRESKAALLYASRGKFFRRVLLEGMPGTFRQASQLINAAKAEMKSQHEALDAAATQREVLADELERSVSGIVGRLASAATQMQSTAMSLADAARVTTERAAVVARTAEDVASSVHAVASASEQLSTSANDMGRIAQESQELVGAAVEASTRTHEIVHGLTCASEEIGSVVRVISGVAQQTNLLALNAAIEAARAGEVGRGFGIVAAEVRALAKQTSGSTEEIAERVGAIQRASSEGVSAIGNIAQSVRHVDARVSRIVEAVDAQRGATARISAGVADVAQGADEVSRCIRTVSENARETDDAVRCLLEAATELSQQAEDLYETTHRVLHAVRNG
ncbi:MAG: hypothetical protein H6721_28385 [Sandaracinus sp.]|nr:hypothetical protein [Sandaracinus sp.]MCB9636048.1 hypothetical protein [Sandaracinus sp.]